VVGLLEFLLQNVLLAGGPVDGQENECVGGHAVFDQQLLDGLEFGPVLVGCGVRTAVNHAPLEQRPQQHARCQEHGEVAHVVDDVHASGVLDFNLPLGGLLDSLFCFVEFDFHREIAFCEFSQRVCLDRGYRLGRGTYAHVPWVGEEVEDCLADDRVLFLEVEAVPDRVAGLLEG